MYRMQATQLRDDQEQDEYPGPTGAQEVLPVLPQPHGAPGDPVERLEIGRLPGDLHLVKALPIAALVTAIFYGLHRLALVAESKGWIFYRTRPPRVRTLGLFEEVFDPRVEYVVAEQSSEAIRADQDDSGEGPPNDQDARTRNSGSQSPSLP